jgi:peptide/nickel transport system substrate-binding protein
MLHSENKILGKISILTLSFVLIMILMFGGSCSDQKKSGENQIVIGVQSDVQTINPMYAFSLIEGNVVDLLFMKPAQEIWNESLGILEFKPMLAEKWEWNKDSTSITLFFRDDIYWSDGVPITIDDIIFSFDVYSDPNVNSRFFGQFDDFYTLENLQIDTNKSFSRVSPRVLIINFKKESSPSFLDVNLEIIPKQIWSKYSREEFSNAETNFKPVTSGPFKIEKWEQEGFISLIIDSSSFLFNSENIQKFIFKVIPDYKTRMIELKTGSIDLLDNIKSEDVSELKLVNNLKIAALRGRDYDYVGWNHSDPEKVGKAPNKFFASSQIRQALSYAINRKEMVDSYLGEFGEISNGPISPMFKLYYDSKVNVYEYNPTRAKEILMENGWLDKNNDGVVEKGSLEFAFDLYLNAGNPRRSYVAQLIKNNLKAVGIDVKINELESGTFIDGLMNRKYEAWIAGWTIPVPIDLNPYWNSDQEIGFLNFSSYRNEEKDEILEKLKQRLTESEKTKLYKDLQSIFQKDEPVTFLYWFDNIIAYNKRISKIDFSVLGLVKNAWEWRIN